ncbi:tetrapyrrole-binding protein, chloroplastic [Quillaja saponaria]|uniref:Tetrapyrrole-binding protein, chloroplastic n=1 Tax=Quillaja saponaria TaxID=32244 RepID=A0AAD7QFT7_QUISA|nr:tetrapyrrole-binding protein, chloroplastic [Quillaja saponaria]
MATNSFQSLQHHHHSLIKRQYPSDTPPATTLSSSLFLKPTTNNLNTSVSLSHSLSSSSSSSITFSISPTTSSTPSTSQTISYDLLEHHLSTSNFREADEETRRLLIALAGEAAQKRGYVFFSEVQFIPETDLKTVDGLWRKYSDNKFGYSVQKKIFHKVDKDFTKFFIKVGWMKKLDTEVVQYNYRAFPNEFIWELKDDTPEGHLPLTNALRGTQLLNCVLNHPAFDQVVQEEEGEELDNGVLKGLRDGSSSKPLSNRVFKTDYSF